MRKNQVEDKALSVAEVAKEFNVAHITVRRWLKAGHIASFRLPGGHYRIPTTEVQRIQTMKIELAQNSTASLHDERPRSGNEAAS